MTEHNYAVGDHVTWLVQHRAGHATTITGKVEIVGRVRLGVRTPTNGLVWIDARRVQHVRGGSRS